MCDLQDPIWEFVGVCCRNSNRGLRGIGVLVRIYWCFEFVYTLFFFFFFLIIIIITIVCYNFWFLGENSAVGLAESCCALLAAGFMPDARYACNLPQRVEYDE